MGPVLIGGGFGLFLCARDGELLFAVVVVVQLLVEVLDVVDTKLAKAAKFEPVRDNELVEVAGDAALLLFGSPWVALIRSEMIVLLLTSQLFGEVGGEVELGDAEAELELATELQLPVLRDKSVGSFSEIEPEV